MASTGNPRRTQSRSAAAQSLADGSATTLPKGSTFHNPSGPPVRGDPILDVHNYPRRAPTSPKGLHELLDGLTERVDELTVADKSSKVQARDERAPKSAFMVKSQKPSKGRSGKSNDPFNVNHRADRLAARSNSDHSHDSDSGIGSSVSAESAPASPELKQRQRAGNSPETNDSIITRTNVATLIKDLRFHTKSAFTQVQPNTSLDTDNKLGRHAADLIQRLIVNPLAEQPRLKSFQKLVNYITPAIELGAITCLRDVEKHLVLQAPKRAATPASYLIFAETAIQCVHHTQRHLAGRDLVRPTDKPYSNHYFVDLIEQVRQYARIMEAHRLATTHGKNKAKSMDVELNEAGLNEMGEIIRLEGGISNDGKPLRLVRVGPNGEVIPIDAEQQRILDTEMEDGERSMARKRKCDIGKEVIRYCRECNKQFPRMCDLTKHEKTHTRPWKCSEPTCEYATSGFATEKECDRHYNDKHDKDPKMYKCLYDNCNYMSKRESNCKQHMEKTHGWQYTRSKSKKDQEIKIPMIRRSELKNLMNTPMSMAMSAATPTSSKEGMSEVATPTSTNLTYSPVPSSSNGIISPDTNDEMGPAFNHSIFSEDFDYDGADFDFPSFGNELGAARSGSLEFTGMMGTPESNVELMSNAGPSSSDGMEYAFPWPAANDLMAQYQSLQQPMQQPTPAYSDYKDFEMPAGTVNLEDLERDPTQLNNGPISPASNAGFSNVNAGDWSLFDRESGGESSTNGNALFPKLDIVNSGFDANQYVMDPMFGNASDEYNTHEWAHDASDTQHQA